MLKIKNLSRKFGSNTALNNINLNLDNGIYGLLGDNGAGKSTLMRLIVGVDIPSEGEIYWNDKEIRILKEEYRKLLGYMPQEFEVYRSFTAYEFLEYIGALKGLTKKELKTKIPEVLNFVNLGEVYNKKVSTFSGGMKRRIGIAQAIINDPKILILDEPTAGLDPGERIRFSNIISDMSKEKIILFSTHIITDIEAITKNVIILNCGKICNNSTTDKLVKEMKSKVFETYISYENLKLYRDNILIIRMRVEGDLVNIRYTGDKIKDSKEVTANLEDYYIYERNIKNEPCN